MSEDPEDRWRRLEQALRDSEALYHSLVEQLPMNVFRKDREGRFLFANERLCRTLGRRRDEVLGRTDHDFSPAALAAKYRADDLRIMESGQRFYDVEEHHEREGEPTYVQVFKTPVQNASGEIVGTQGFFVDITELKRTEASLVKKTSELEEALRALREHQEKLLVSEKMASLGRLTAGIAHEMNTPLAAVRSALASLETLTAEYRDAIGDGEVGPDDHRQIAADMEKTVRLATLAATHAAGFVHGIKGHTQDLGRKQRQRFNAVPVIEDALMLLTYALRHAACAISFQPAGATIDLVGAPGRLAQVVTNLVKNAVEASAHSSGGAVTLRLTRDDDVVTLRVQDRGTGIPAAVVGKIFDPMFTTKPFGEGTGLGLTIVHDIVVADFDGTIDVETAIGEGTTFTVRFPRPA